MEERFESNCGQEYRPLTLLNPIRKGGRYDRMIPLNARLFEEGGRELTAQPGLEFILLSERPSPELTGMS